MKDRQKRVITALYAAMKEADGLHDGGSVAMSIFELLLGLESDFKAENEKSALNGTLSATRIIHKSRRFNAAEIKKKRRPWYDALQRASMKKAVIA